LLRHQLTSRQTVNLYKVITEGERLAQLSLCDRTFGAEATSAMEKLWDALDIDCLELCVSLLDHDLKGDLFESAVVGFLAAIAVDPIKGILKKAYHFTPTLSGFIKIAQMLVIQKAVVGAREVENIQPAFLTKCERGS
jgi:DNA integrity scanning protein DisA with diadenylate cyclase activity